MSERLRPDSLIFLFLIPGRVFAVSGKGKMKEMRVCVILNSVVVQDVLLCIVTLRFVLGITCIYLQAVPAFFSYVNNVQLWLKL